MSKKLILVVGLQKSGTTLLLRLLQHSGLIENPFRKEGHAFWGNKPIFSPSAYPAGTVYQKYRGERGHEIGVKDLDDTMTVTLRKRLQEISHVRPLIVNKNPFNTVRIRWLRMIFPEAYIVAVIRDPVANVFSLLKKFTPHPGIGTKPECGWWGVKPNKWQKYIFEDKVVQLAHQWQMVNAKLREDQQFIDQIICYEQLCQKPKEIIETIIQNVFGENFFCNISFPQLLSQNDEYQRGSSLLSKNRQFLSTQSFAVQEGHVEIFPLNHKQIIQIRAICGDYKIFFPYR